MNDSSVAAFKSQLCGITSFSSDPGHVNCELKGSIIQLQADGAVEVCNVDVIVKEELHGKYLFDI